MNFEIVELEQFSGEEASVYSVLPMGEEIVLFEQFVIEHQKAYAPEIRSILQRIKIVARKHGAREQFFKLKEGKPGDGVAAIFDVPDKSLRLYCIRFGMNLIILGGGGPKPKQVKAYQEDANLDYHANLMIEVSKKIGQKIKAGDIRLSHDGKQLIGDLIFDDDDY